jgi:hypothetical protein
MIVFIIPLKSKQVSKDWERVSKLLERCVRSITNQTSEKFKVIIVCHEQPNIQINDPSINYLHANFLPPNLEEINAVNLMDKDKNNKMWLGLEYAHQLNPSHVMFVDADDCISCHIAKFVNDNPHVNGWFLDSGYVYKDGSNRIFYKKKNFYWLSGTSHIIKYSLLQDKSIKSFYTESNDALHQRIVKILEERKTSLVPLPFPGAVYITENGENIYQGTPPKPELSLFFFKELILTWPRQLRELITFQPLKESIIHEFSLNLVVPTN